MQNLSIQDINSIAREVAKEIAKEVAREVAKEVAKEAAKETVRETMLSLGLATSREEDIIQFQGDMAWLRKQRQTTEKIAWGVKVALMTSAVSGFLYVMWEGFKLALQKGT